MRHRLLPICMLFVALAVPRTVAAQVSSAGQIADVAALRQAVAAKAATDEQNRRAVLDVLDRSEVKKAAAKMGLDVKKARSAVVSMQGERLAELASVARSEEAPPRRANSVTLSVTTLLLLLILIVLIVD